MPRGTRLDRQAPVGREPSLDIFTEAIKQTDTMPADSTAPKVFVSHASEDKERFVLPFAEQLRARGVDAWLDKWEMLPGDSLVDKIFEEGLKEAAAVLIVLSKVSVTKPWVREELNAAVVKRIEKGTKIIPIVLDGCEVPQALRSLVWESVKDVSDFGDCLGRVVDAVFGHTSKPPVGPAPAYTANTAVPRIRGLTAAESLVLKALYDAFLIHGREYISPSVILASATDQGLDMSMVSDSLEILAHQHYVELLRHLGPGPYHARIKTSGVSVMLGRDEQDLIRQVGLSIVNDELMQSGDIAAATGRPRSLVDHAIHRLQGQGHIKSVSGLDQRTFIHHVSPTLRRALGT